LLGGDASFGLRLPFLQVNGNQFVEDSLVGDISLIAKYAVLNNAGTGDVISGGLVLTVPSGEATDLLGIGKVRGTLFQPWAGFIWNWGNAYVHGFSSVVVPTDSRVATILFNDVGFGYRLLNRDGHSFISAFVPTVECHVNTPLEDLSDRVVIGIPDIVDVTAGAYIVFGRATTLGAAVATPVTGPRPFSIEALVSLNVRF
jgi:hypothetical protein